MTLIKDKHRFTICNIQYWFLKLHYYDVGNVGDLSYELLLKMLFVNYCKYNVFTVYSY